MDRISPNFVYAFILTRSRLGLLHVIFCFFVREPLINVRNLFLLNIFMNLAFLQHEKRCSGTIVRFSDNSSLHVIINKKAIIFLMYMYSDLSGPKDNAIQINMIRV